MCESSRRELDQSMQDKHQLKVRLGMVLEEQRRANSQLATTDAGLAKAILESQALAEEVNTLYASL